MRKKKTDKPREDFGTCTFYCKACDYAFEMEWETIFEIQEMTHGYIGYHLNDVFINCPKCDEIILEDNRPIKSNALIDEDLLF